MRWSRMSHVAVHLFCSAQCLVFAPRARSGRTALEFASRTNDEPIARKPRVGNREGRESRCDGQVEIGP